MNMPSPPYPPYIALLIINKKIYKDILQLISILKIKNYGK